MMRVLWFTSVVPSAVSEHLDLDANPGPASWVESLRRAICRTVGLELAIAAPCPTPFVPFRSEGVAYYGIPTTLPRTRLGRAASGWANSVIAQGDVRSCLRIAADFRPHLIHVHGTENPYGLIAEHTDTPVLVSLQGLLTIYSKFYFHGLAAHEIARLALSRETLLGRGEIHGYWRSVRTAVRERRILRSKAFFAGRTEWDSTVLSLINPSAIYYRLEEVLRRPFYEAEWRRETSDPRVVFCIQHHASQEGRDAH